jgi:hypothetical protein
VHVACVLFKVRISWGLLYSREWQNLQRKYVALREQLQSSLTNWCFFMTFPGLASRQALRAAARDMHAPITVSIGFL